MTSNLLHQASSPTLQIVRPKSIPTPFISLIWVPSHPLFQSMTSYLLPQASSPTLQIVRPKSIPTPFISLIWVPSHPLFQSMTSYLLPHMLLMPVQGNMTSRGLIQ